MSSPALQDILTPIDPTAYTSISGSQLLQILSSLMPYLDKGMAIVTTDIAGVPTVPDARTDSSTTSTRWQRYLWIRQSATSVGVYVWNPTGAVDATFLQWVSINIAGIAAGSIVNNMIADNTIQSVKIVSLDWSKLTGVPSGLAPGGAAGGDLTGDYPNPSVANGAVTGAKIAVGTITAANIANLTLTLALDAPISGSAKDMARVNAGATGMEAFTPPVLFTSGVVVPTANAGKVPQVNPGATDFQMVAPTTLGRVLQVVEAFDITTDTTTLNSTLTTAVTTSNTKHEAGLDVAITPLSSGSKLMVEACVFLLNSSNNAILYAALFQDAGAAALAVGTNADDDNARPKPVIVRYSVASGSTAARTFKVGIGNNAAGNLRYNSTDGATTPFNGLGLASWLRVTEYL